MHPLRPIHYTDSNINDIQKLMGLILATASTGALIITLQSLVSGIAATALATGSGLALQVCLYLFARHPDHRVRWFSYGLLGLSVIVTAWYMETTWQSHHRQQLNQQQQQISNQFQVKQQQQQITQLNQQIDILLASAEQDTGNQYRARGLNTLNELEALNQRRDKLLADIQQQGRITATELSGQTLFEQNDSIRLFLFLAIALIIDLAAIIALNPVPAMAASQEDDRNIPADPEHIKPPSHLENILEKIRLGEYGEFVPVKQIIENEPIRHPELKIGLEQLLLEEGVISKVGNRYRHFSFDRQTELCDI
ncbi:hypothetical protein ACTL6P_11755 [Endozoicomonas acroporae]|uniref:hypothetical protein n=1 Tax=Endozoicomonas acroporae TaxID=1701104 RepID=UPI000C75704A|nr:hypothetical protein [Endozoicomonas acroporae]